MKKTLWQVEGFFLLISLNICIFLQVSENGHIFLLLFILHLLYEEKLSRGETFTRKIKREILGIYFHEWPTKSFSREKNFRELRVFRIRFCWFSLKIGSFCKIIGLLLRKTYFAWDKLSQICMLVLFVGIHFCENSQKIAKTRNFLPSKLSLSKVTLQ